MSTPANPPGLQRLLAARLPGPDASRRIVVLTGARQVGKTTLAQALWPEQRYLNLDSPGERARLGAVPAEGWSQAVGAAILDEVQKLPSAIEKIKWAFDAGQIDFSVLLGSSRILLLDSVRETLAGRVFLYELYPLTVSELAPHFGGRFCPRPLVAELAAEPGAALARLAELGPVVGPEVGAAEAATQHLLAWGGLPTLLRFEPEERWAWLDAYQTTFLERDLGDLARLHALEPFATCHRLAAARAGAILVFAELARDAALPIATVRRYLRYLELSYQTYTLPAWAGNPTVRLVKAPKLGWFDLGVQRQLSGQLRGLTGAQYETAVVGQILATLASLGIRSEASYLRTGGGLEVDLVLESQDGALLFELKSRAEVGRRDSTPIERAHAILGNRYRAGIVIYRGNTVERLGETVWAVPDWRLLGFGPG